MMARKDTETKRRRRSVAKSQTRTEAVATTLMRLSDVKPTIPAKVKEFFNRIDMEIADATKLRVSKMQGAKPEEIDAQLAQLDEEWSADRAAHLMSGLVGIMGMMLALWYSWFWLMITFVALGSACAHAIMNWSAWSLFYRIVGLRNDREINAERFALKVARGDLKCLTADNATEAVVAELHRTPAQAQ